jgi:hypothetical protein
VFGANGKPNQKVKYREKINKLLGKINSEEMMNMTSKQLKNLQFCLNKIVPSGDYHKLLVDRGSYDFEI